MHEHLGVTLLSNNKWNKHVELIIKSASKQVSYLRKAKYQFSKEILSKLHCTYIRPLLEYASEVDMAVLKWMHIVSNKCN